MPYQLLADGQVRFYHSAAGATQVELALVDLPLWRGRQAMAAAGDLWSVTIGPIAPGVYRYSLVEDGRVVVDAGNPHVLPAQRGASSYFVVPDAATLDARGIAHGAVSAVHYDSAALGVARRAYVYTPPGYERGTADYPVLYLLHGSGDSEAAWPVMGRAGFILDHLIAAGRAEPMLVVMPNGHVSSEVARPGEDIAAFEAFAADFWGDLLPEVERRYRVRTARADRAVAGLSMGGAQTLYLAVPHLDRFAHIGVFSSGLFEFGAHGRAGADAEWAGRHAATLDDPALRVGLRALWVRCGRDDFLLATSDATVAAFRRHGFAVDYQLGEGGHEWSNWRDYLAEFAPLLFR